MSAGRAATVLGLLALAPAAAQGPQLRVRVGVEPAVVTVGEPFHVIVHAAEGRGGALRLVIEPDPSGTFEATGEHGSDPAAGLAWARVVAWRTAAPAELPATLQLTASGRTVRTPVRLRAPVVRSVLPADSGVVPPRPPRDVVGPDREPRWALIGGATAAALLLLLGALARRRRRGAAGPPPRRDARGDALRALDRIRAADHLERGEVRRFYEETAEVLRAFAAAWSQEWSRDLTTAELLARLRAAAAPGVSQLAQVLQSADHAKFTGRPPVAEQALQEWALARQWVAEQPGGRP